MANVYEKLREYKKRYFSTIMWRTKAHSKLVEENLHEGEEIIYAFAGQKDTNHIGFFNTFVVVLTNTRLIVAQKRLIVGYSLNSITPDLFNDLRIVSGVVWGAVTIDTVKEVIYLTNISKKALPEIQKTITKFMINEKKKYIVKGKE